MLPNQFPDNAVRDQILSAGIPDTRRQACMGRLHKAIIGQQFVPPQVQFVKMRFLADALSGKLQS
jgi:hypothetical protein